MSEYIMEQSTLPDPLFHRINGRLSENTGVEEEIRILPEGTGIINRSPERYMFHNLSTKSCPSTVSYF